MDEFKLIPLDSKKDPVTGKTSVAKSPIFRAYLIISLLVLCSIIILNNMNYPLPFWVGIILIGAFPISIYPFWELLVSPKTGKVIFQEDKIFIRPSKNHDKFSDSPIHIKENSTITIDTIQQYLFPKKTLLHITISGGDAVNEFGFILSNKTDHLRYLVLLDRWYKNGITIRESDMRGHRVFKLNKGKTYAEVQNIKQEYGLD